MSLTKQRFSLIAMLAVVLCCSLILLDESMTELIMGFNKITSLTPDIGLFLKLVFLDLRYGYAGAGTAVYFVCFSFFHNCDCFKIIVILI